VSPMIPTRAMLFTPFAFFCAFIRAFAHFCALCVSLCLVAVFTQHLKSVSFTEHPLYEAGEVVKGT